MSDHAQRAEQLGLKTLEELDRVADELGCDRDKALYLLEENRRSRAELADRDSHPNAPRHRYDMVEPERVAADLKTIVDRAQGSTRAAEADALIPRHLRRPATGRPPAVSYRAQVVRRVSERVSPPLWWYRFGAHSDQVKAWYADRRSTTDPVERAVLHRLHVAAAERGGYPRVFPLVALAHLLWFGARTTERPGYKSSVDGVPRGELARRSGHRYRGQPLHPDRISHHLAELKKALGGILEFDQPRPESARAAGLHKSMHYLRDGSTNLQFTNVYWWRDAQWVIRNQLDPGPFERRVERAGETEARTMHTLQQPIEKVAFSIGSNRVALVDRKQGYKDQHKDQRVVDHAGPVEKVSPSATRSGARGAPQFSCPRARDGPPDEDPPAAAPLDIANEEGDRTRR